MVIATGFAAKPFPGITIDHRAGDRGRRAITCPAVPKSLIVMGSGAVGVEFTWRYDGSAMR